MKVSKSAHYKWSKHPAMVISVNALDLFCSAKAIFKASRNSLASRELAKKLFEEGFKITRYRDINLMRRLNLVFEQRVAYKKVTNKRNHSDSIADNLLNRNFNPIGPVTCAI
ncbi:hypothetical protein [Glaciecola sp. KUL10]|uniref:hypothetical protein n=1 Tax=Glaciecola sp. (strain KUL10) TaxID=2161813 RepID=UPI000D7848BE|nr:hypothetical protein [Glaciecola sp. KUL10]